MVVQTLTRSLGNIEGKSIPLSGDFQVHLRRVSLRGGVKDWVPSLARKQLLEVRTVRLKASHVALCTLCVHSKHPMYVAPLWIVLSHSLHFTTCG